MIRRQRHCNGKERQEALIVSNLEEISVVTECPLQSSAFSLNCNKLRYSHLFEGNSLIQITELVEITDDIVRAFDRLIPQLSSSNPPPDAEQLCEIAFNSNTVLLVARETSTGDIVGTLTLVLFRIPTGLQARIEDVVVDRSQRGKSIGKELTNAAISKARTAGAKTVGLTSRPSREAANHLYSAMGFEQRATNVYRLNLL